MMIIYRSSLLWRPTLSYGYTHENSVENTLAFLDVCVTVGENTFSTSVFRKPTNTGHVMNAKSECPEKYKNSVIKSFVRRAIKVSSTYELMHSEFNRTKQILVSNWYSNRAVDAEIEAQLKRYIDRRDAPTDGDQTDEIQRDGEQRDEAHRDGEQRYGPQRDGTQRDEHIRLYYRNFMNSSYTVDESAIRKVIQRNVKCVDRKLTLIIFSSKQKKKQAV